MKRMRNPVRSLVLSLALVALLGGANHGYDALLSCYLAWRVLDGSKVADAAHWYLDHRARVRKRPLQYAFTPWTAKALGWPSFRTLNNTILKL